MITDQPHPLDPSSSDILAMGEEAMQLVAEYYASLPGLRIMPDVSSAGIRELLSQPLPTEGTDFHALLATVRDAVFATSRHNGHPRFFGYVASPGSAATAIADLLASALNSNVTSWRSGPGATELERQTVGWIKELLGYPTDAEGLFVSGGSMAHLCGLAAARDAKAPINVAALGSRALPAAMRVYMSSEGHHSIVKAARLLGIGHENVRPVAVDASFRIDLVALREAIEEDLRNGMQPFCIVGTAGTVATGACDPLEGIASIAEEFGLWFHIDACYGGFAAMAPSKRELFRGIERADSVALDPHKWLYIPADCGCILYRDPARARASFGHDAEYIRVLDREADEAYAFWDYGPELSRRFRALKVWMMLAHAGTRVLGEAIESNCRCAEHLAALVRSSDDFEMLAPVELSIFCFRYFPPEIREEYASATIERRSNIDRQLNTLNEHILSVVQRDGHSYLSNANIHGLFALRGCVLNYRTTMNDMEVLLEDVRKQIRK
jgi:glutamate/tyrosine decarboxylase-like PLP-dependent enzyme